MRISDWSSDVCSSDLELAARQRRRHADDADIGAFGQRIDRLPVGIDARAQRLEILDAAYVVLERERGDLGRVDDRSAADRDDQVRVDRPRRLDRAEHVRAGGVRRDAVKGAGMTAAESSLYPHDRVRSEEHTSEIQSLMRISYAVICLKKKTMNIT